MATFNLNSLPKEKRIQMIGEFYDAINSLKDRNEVRLFLKDLLTPNEIAALMRRIEIAILLEAGFTYRQVSELLGVGMSKITSVQKTLSKDDNGYKIIIKRILEDRKRRIKKIKDKESMNPLKKMIKAQPGRFAFFDFIEELSESLDKNPEKIKEAALFTPSASFFRNKKKK
jgi:TrpR-related protein YerC/YecD